MGWPEWRISEVITARPHARVNQLGYLLGRPKQAIVMIGCYGAGRLHRSPPGRRRRPHRTFTGLVDTTGAHVGPQRSCPGLQRANIPGAGFRIEAGAQISHPFEITSRLYERLSADALRFFYVMRSGTRSWTDLPRAMAGRPASRAATESRRPRSACVDGAGSASALSGVAL